MNGDPRHPAGTPWSFDTALARIALGTAGSPGAGAAAASVATAFRQAWEGAEPDALDLADPAQRLFGEYELQELIGRGGMGVVYRAREHRLDREVALKLLSAGMHAPEGLIEVLRSEARHAARLQHPNIVAIYEMGEHDGMIFYAMQLVRGSTLSQCIDADGAMAPAAAARLLRTIAEAIDYAHRLGLLHLDLKPGNILLDRDGSPLIADFGLARPLGQVDALDASGTPGYMAPEQAQPGCTPLSTATDVWALGAILHEMLTGEPPFHGDSVEETLALARQAPHAERLRAAGVPANLEAICLHCLQVDPARRYPDARALADDLNRFIEGRSVSVRTPGSAERICNWARRDPKIAVASSLTLLALSTGLAVSTWMWRQADRNAQQAADVNRFLNDDVLAAADPYLSSGSAPDQVSIPALLADAERKLDQGKVRDPAVRARIGLSLGRAYFGLGMWSEARRRLGSALADSRHALGPDAALTLDIEQYFGRAAIYSGSYTEAREIYGHLLPKRMKVSGENSPLTIAAQHDHALLLHESDQFEQALAEFESVRQAAERHAPELLPETEWVLSEIYAELNRWNEAEAMTRSALARSLRKHGPYHPQYLWETLTLGDIQMMEGRWDEADEVFRNARERLLGTVGARHPKSITALHYQGVVLLERGRADDALPLLRQAMEERQSVHGDHHPYSHYSMNRVGQALIALGRNDEAIAVLERALLLANEADRDGKKAYTVMILANLIDAHAANGDTDRAEAYQRQAMAFVSGDNALPPNNVRLGMLMRSMGNLAMVRGAVDDAVRHYRYADDVFRTGFGDRHHWVLDLERRLAATGHPAQPSIQARQ